MSNPFPLKGLASLVRDVGYGASNRQGDYRAHSIGPGKSYGCCILCASLCILQLIHWPHCSLLRVVSNVVEAHCYVTANGLLLEQQRSTMCVSNTDQVYSVEVDNTLSVAGTVLFLHLSCIGAMAKGQYRSVNEK